MAMKSIGDHLLDATKRSIDRYKREGYTSQHHYARGVMESLLITAEREFNAEKLQNVGAEKVDKSIKVQYTNYRGETGIRNITPIRVYWGSTEYHPKPQWLMTAIDNDKMAYRDFALADMIFINN